MNRTCKFIATLSLALPLTLPVQAMEDSPSASNAMSGRALQSLIKSAHTTEQYKQLASCYHQQETMYRSKAAEQKTEWDRRMQVNAALMQKYPRPVDSAKDFYERYSTDAENAALMARRYDQLAGEAPNRNNNQSTLQ